MWVYVDATLPAPLYSSGVQVFAQNPWDATNYINCGGSTNTGTWFNASVTLNSGATTVTALGLQLTGIRPGSLGNIYIDAVTITLPAGPTATPTGTATPSTANSFYFDGGSIPAGWSVVPTGAVTNSLLILESPGYIASAGCMGVTTTWSATGQTVNVQYAYGSPTNWTALGITGFRAEVMVNPQFCSGGGCQLYCQSGSYTWENSAWTNEPAANTWTQLNWTPPFTTVPSTPVSVQQFGVQFATGGSGSAFATSTLFVDSVELY